MITVKQARKNLRYDEATGLLWWRVRDSGRQMNRPAGSTDGNGYILVGFRGKSYRASRLAFLIKLGRWPIGEVDHKNLRRSDNRWRNLREASRSDNQANSRIYKNNASGAKGVSWHPQHKKWYVTIQKNRVVKFIGLFSNKQKARLAYIKAAKQLHGEFARAA